MSTDKSRSTAAGGQSNHSQPTTATPVVVEQASTRLFRSIDWITFAVTFFVVMVGYLLTIAPDVTLEDSGELAVASMYAGVPHPPGYPVWTLYTWLFTKLVPISNIAFRVALSSAFAAALSCGLIGLMVSRGSSMMIESLEQLRTLSRRSENWICIVSGFVAGMLIGFNGFMWSQAVIVEVYTLSVLSLVGVLCCLLRWVWAPGQRGYLYLSFFLFGICFTNHQTLVVAAMGIQILIIAANRRVGRDLLMGNCAVFVAALIAQTKGGLSELQNNPPLNFAFMTIGVASLIAWVSLTLMTRKTREDWYALGRDLCLMGGLLYWVALLVSSGLYARMIPEGMEGIHLAGLGCWAGAVWLTYQIRRKAGSSLVGLVGLCAWIAFFVYLLGLMVVVDNPPRWMTDHLLVFWGIHLLGMLTLACGIFCLHRERSLGSEVKVLIGCGLMWFAGAALYFYMPIASMSNPPLNWGYPRTVEGLVHTLTRGQYEKARPTTDPIRYVQQIGIYAKGATEEFNVGYLLIGVIPFLLLRRMGTRERAWLIGLAGIYFCLAFILLFLLNPSADLQSLQLNRVFFTASHVMIAMFVGYGLALAAGYITLHYEEFRVPALAFAGAALLGAIFYCVYKFENTLGLTRLTAILGIVLAAGVLASMLVRNSKLRLSLLLGAFCLMPTWSILAHWSDNEQRGHLFGFWFGHDMFTPPFNIYPEMAKDAVLFGGTDPGRFNPTYMIFCESFIPPSKRRDPNFDRRDVYLITQNALADGTYLNYIRAHYNRSAQFDKPFFQELLRSDAERINNYTTNVLSRSLIPLDRYFTSLGERIEKDRRERGVYPKNEIHTPNDREARDTFQAYIDDAATRQRSGRLEPGEELTEVEPGRFQVSGQVSVMAINGLLTKIIFEANPNHEFYVEESMPLKWMYEHLTPFGIIMKINREKVGQFTSEMLKKDRDFWTQYSERLIGNWIQPSTPLEEVTAFAQRVFVQGDLKGFKGDPKFIRDDNAQKAFSKLRSAIGGLYYWRWEEVGRQLEQARLSNPSGTPDPELLAEFNRVQAETDFAFRQSFAFCPYSPEAVYRYAEFLIKTKRVEGAILITKVALKLDPNNERMAELLKDLQTGTYGATQATPPSGHPIYKAFQEIREHLQKKRPDLAAKVTKDFLALPETVADVRSVLALADAFLKLENMPLLELTLVRLTELAPGAPETWFNLARLQSVDGRQEAAAASIAKSFALQDQLRKTNPAAPDLRTDYRTNADFKALRGHPAGKALK